MAATKREIAFKSCQMSGKMDFEPVLSAILASNNATRRQGEQSFAQYLAQDAVSTAHRLCAAMMHPRQDVAVLAAVLFRRKYFEEQLLAKVAPSERQLLRAQLLALVSPDRSLYYLKRLADVLVNFAVADCWETDLLGFMATWARSSSPVVKEFALHLFEEAVEFKSLLTVLRVHVATVMEILRSALVDSNLEVALSAAKTIACFLEGSESEDTAMVWAQALPAVLSVVLSAVKTTIQVERIKDTLESLAELTNSYSLLWTAYLPDLIAAVGTISKDKGHNNELRFAAVSLLLTLINASPALVQSNALFLQECIVLGLTLMAELSNLQSEDTWTQESDEDDISRNDMFLLGKDVICAIAASVGGPLLLGTMSQLIPRYLKSEDWVRQHTGILAIGLIGEGCKETYKGSMGSLLDLVLPFTASQYQRLRWAALTSLGLLIGQFHPLVQTQFAERTLMCVLACMQEGNVLRVITQAASCLNMYTSGFILHPATLPCFAPFVQQVLHQLSEVLGRGLNLGYCPLLEEVLSTIGHVAIALKTGFSQYVNNFVPGLRRLAACPVVTEEQRDVRTNCVCCLSAIVESIKEDQSHCALITELLSFFLASRQELSPEDSFASDIEQCMPQFAVYLQGRFHSYLPSILPDLLQKASSAVESQLCDAESSSQSSSNPKEVTHTVQFELRGRGVKQLMVNSSALLSKIGACRTLMLLVRSLGEGFVDYLQPVIQAVGPLIHYQKNGDIRKYALATIMEGLKACHRHESIVKAAVAFLLPEFNQAFHFFALKNTSKLKRLLNNLNTLLRLCSQLPTLGLSSVESLSQVLGKQVQMALQRRDTRESELSKASQSPLHQSLYADLKFADSVDVEITRRTMEFIEICLKAFGKEYKSLFQQYFQCAYFGIFYKPRPHDNEIISAVCVLDHLAEFAGEIGLSSGTSFTIEHLLGCIAHPNVDIQQSAVYGLGVCSQVASPEIYCHYADAIVNSVVKMLQNPQCRTAAYLVATECAVGALGKIALYQQSELLEMWLQWLPISAEIEEAQSVNGLFLSHLDMYRGSPQTPRVIQSLKSLLAASKPVVKEADLHYLA